MDLMRMPAVGPSPLTMMDRDLPDRGGRDGRAPLGAQWMRCLGEPFTDAVVSDQSWSRTRCWGRHALAARGVESVRYRHRGELAGHLRDPSS